jgi:hypothetical protein
LKEVEKLWLSNKSMNDKYQKYLKSEHWKQFRKRFFKQKLYRKTCVVCGKRNVDLHHRTYCRLYKEKLTDVIPLCWKHYKEVHTTLENNGLEVEETYQALMIVMNCSLKAVKKKLGAFGLKPSPRIYYELGRQLLNLIQCNFCHTRCYQYPKEPIRCDKCGGEVTLVLQKEEYPPEYLVNKLLPN